MRNSRQWFVQVVGLEGTAAAQPLAVTVDAARTGQPITKLFGGFGRRGPQRRWMPVAVDRRESRPGAVGLDVWPKPGCQRVDCAVWQPNSDLATAAAAWIYAGGAHHKGFSRLPAAEHPQDFADTADMEFLCIDEETQVRAFRNELRWNAAAYS